MAPSKLVVTTYIPNKAMILFFLFYLVVFPITILSLHSQMCRYSCERLDFFLNAGLNVSRLIIEKNEKGNEHREFRR